MYMKKTIVLLILPLLCGMVRAHDFVVTLDGQKVYFNITSEIHRTVEVTYNGGIADGKPTYYVGELTVPAKVRHNNKVYKVTAIGPKAFSGADRMTGVVLPSGLTSIGDFAFEGCTSLSRVIFPGNSVTFGQGVFFRCDKIRDVSLGSDWKEVDLRMFRWSDSLAFIDIPVKMERVRNLKSLKCLDSVTVDPNNSRFSAKGGVLYDKSGKTLYGCPRAYKGKVVVPEGTETVLVGALMDCYGVTAVDLPASLVSMSFREFGQLSGLSEIEFRGDAPMMTAEREGEKVFLLQVKNRDVKIAVPQKSRKVYREALVTAAGEYTEINGDKPYLVESGSMPYEKNIISAGK